MENEMIEKEYELYVLTGETNAYSVRTLSMDEPEYILPIEAYVIKNTNELIKGRITLKWKDNHNFTFEKNTIYLIRGIATIKANQEIESMPKHFKLKKVVEKNATNGLLEEYLKMINVPIIKNDNDFGDFVFNRKYNWFEGRIDWLGKTCNIYLKVSEEGEDFNTCLDYFKKIYSNLKQFNNEIIEYVSNELLLTAISWNKTKNTISKEEFVKQLSIESIKIFKDGDFDIYYTCGNIFLGHVINIRGNYKHGLNYATLVG